MTNGVTVDLCNNVVPFQNVDRKGFKEMVKTLSQVRVTCPHTLHPQIEMPKLYGEVREQVEKEINTIKH